jgi:hypothetical protein
VDFEMNDDYLTGLGAITSGGLSFLDNKSGLNFGDSRTFLKWSLVEPELFIWKLPLPIFEDNGWANPGLFILVFALLFLLSGLNFNIFIPIIMIIILLI